MQKRTQKGMIDMSVYLSARYDRLADMQTRARELTWWGIPVGSRWHTHEAREALEAADEDYADVRACSTLVLFTDDKEDDVPVNGGRYVELGMAMGWGREILLVGPYTNVFTHMIGYQFATWEECLEWMKQHKNLL